VANAIPYPPFWLFRIAPCCVDPEAMVLSPRLLLDSRVVIGQFLRNSLFLQAFYEGCDRGGIFGKSRLISSAYVLSMICKTPESNKSQGGL
jgi:hypothetical protein